MILSLVSNFLINRNEVSYTHSMASNRDEDSSISLGVVYSTRVNNSNGRVLESGTYISC